MEIVKGNYGYDINFTVNDNNNDAVDLTGVTKVLFNVVLLPSHRNFLSGECTVVNLATGEVKYTVQSLDFEKVGVFVWSLQLQYATKVVDTKEFYITVREKNSP